MLVVLPHDSAQLLQFVEDELARAPLLIDDVLQSVVDAPAQADSAASPMERNAGQALRDILDQARPQVVRAFTGALRTQVQLAAHEPHSRLPGGDVPPATGTLALLGDDEIEADVELQRVTALIHSSAEYELRELDSFTRALVGDRDVAQGTTPMPPHAYAKALLAGVRAVPAGRTSQRSLMNALAVPFAHAVRRAYAAACTRLEDQGIEPAALRTVVLRAGTPGASPAAPTSGLRSVDLQALRDSMPLPLDDVPPQEPAARAAVPSSRTRTRSRSRSRLDHQVIELLARLFDVIVSDPALAPDLQRLLSRLQASAVRVALRDPGMLDDHVHPVWNFIDQLAFSAERLRGDDEMLQRFLRYADGLIATLVAEGGQDAALYRWGQQRLLAHDEHVLLQHCKAAQSQIDALRTQTLSTAQASKQHGPTPAAGGIGAGSTPPPGVLDIGSLETVPAELMDVPASAGACRAAVAEPAVQTGPGDWVNLFLQGEWRSLQLLWTDGARQLFLFRQPGSALWALQRGAVERLEQAGLMEPLEPASLVQHAAAQVLRTLPAAMAR